MQTWRFISGPQNLLISHPEIFFFSAFVKEAVYVRPLPTTSVGLKNGITTAALLDVTIMLTCLKSCFGVWNRPEISGRVIFSKTGSSINWPCHSQNTEVSGTID
jgi:hypothetical protein